MHAELQRLVVVHRLKDAAGHGLSDREAEQLTAGGLYLDTCLRQLCVRADSAAPLPTGEIMHGREAYAFLLTTITGLNSSVPGETNIQGQFRCAWKRWRKSAPAEQLSFLERLVPALLADSKQVRRTYLENLGGASYGTLTRKLLQPDTDARILFVGSGKFARSMLPVFGKWQTALWNHRLHPGLQTDARIFEPSEANEAAQWANQLVLTTPAEDRHDQQWLQLARDHAIGHVVHLGRRRAEPGCWDSTPIDCVFHDLDDVFDLRQQQATLRDLRTLRARRACERIARDHELQQAGVTVGPLAVQGI